MSLCSEIPSSCQEKRTSWTRKATDTPTPQTTREAKHKMCQLCQQGTVPRLEIGSGEWSGKTCCYAVRPRLRFSYLRHSRLCLEKLLETALTTLNRNCFSFQTLPSCVKPLKSRPLSGNHGPIPVPSRDHAQTRPLGRSHAYTRPKPRPRPDPPPSLDHAPYLIPSPWAPACAVSPLATESPVPAE